MINAEALFLDIHQLLEKNQLSEAYHALYDLIAIDPGHGRAHNYLGWIYETKFKDFHKAKIHYELAIKFCENDYAVAYTNYIYMLIDFNEYDEALRILELAKHVIGMDYSVLFYQKGRIMEGKLKFKQAYFYYRSARLRTLNNEFIKLMNIDIERISHKMTWYQRLLGLYKF